jgi:hypothetical protein
VPVTERFGGLRRIALHKAGIAVRQVDRKKVDLAFNPGDLRQRLAKIHLRMTKIVPQRHKHLAVPQPVHPLPRTTAGEIRNATISRFQPLIATTAMERSTSSCSENSVRAAS